eukprot:NODE_240_length_2408_cov_16.315812_g187_i0.p1 GENE.NODE_240_length_2408_cov_16.315812_g187_i0~~NODE_240_length_2408_cov_16.315812_g187_i0.p1  ORF type:complete len:777 (+),score=183.64 NODE_240_length_2408_cov_16.315812_g187_i0:24-2333(+)
MPCGGHGTCTAAGCECDRVDQVPLYTASYADSYTFPNGTSVAYNRSRGGHWACPSGARICTGSCSVCAATHGTEAGGCVCRKSGGQVCHGRGSCNATTASGSALFSAGLYQGSDSDAGCHCAANNSDGYFASSSRSAGVLRPDGCDICSDFTSWGYVGLDSAGNQSTTERCNCPVTRSADGSISNVCGAGTCTLSGCVCDESDAKGYFVQAANGRCSVCKGTWFGHDGTSSVCRCKNQSGVICGGHGECDAEGKCSCYSNFSLGFWTGAPSCDRCRDGAGGTDASGALTCKCSPAQCGGRGACEATGCNCSNSPTTGFWTRNTEKQDGCGACMTGYSGGTCSCGSATGCVTLLTVSNAGGSPITVNARASTTLDNGIVYTFTSGTLVSSDNATVHYNPELKFEEVPSGGDPAPYQDGMQWLGQDFYLTISTTNSTGGTQTSTAGRRARGASALQAVSYCRVGSTGGTYSYFMKEPLQLTIPANMTAAGATSTFISAEAAVYVYDSGVQEGDNVGVGIGTGKGWYKIGDATQCGGGGGTVAAGGEVTVTASLCCIPKEPGTPDFFTRHHKARIALFAPLEPVSYWEQNKTVIIILLVLIVALLLLLIIVIAVISWRVYRNIKDRRAKEMVIKYLTQKNEGKAASLRRTLKLKPGEAFTVKIAIERMMSHIRKSRSLVSKLQKMGSLQPQAGNKGDGIQGTMSQNFAALSRLYPLSVQCIKDGDSEDAKAGRTLRGMFDQGSKKLRTGALDDLRFKLLMAQMQRDLMARNN